MVFDIVFLQVLLGFGAAWLLTEKETKKRIGLLKQLLAAIGPMIICTFTTLLLLGKFTQNQMIALGAIVAFPVAMLSFYVLGSRTSASAKSTVE